MTRGATLPAVISVVVPIYNVERYLADCLDSVLAQTVDDLEVVMVDDGSTDGSAAIARAYAERDRRFRLLSQPNAGLSAARNTGIEAATGEYLAFLDSDDLLPPDAYGHLLGALAETGSDFASGNVLRLTTWGTSQAPFLAEAFDRTRLRTHVTRFPPLLSDRTAWNKLWRRSFWDEHAKRFPEGVVHEDIPVVLPAHFMARAMDAIADPVYLYRIREDGELSITQGRREPRVLLDRLAAIERVLEHLDRHGSAEAKRLYRERVVADDLRYHRDVLDGAGDEYRALFLDRANAFLDAAGPGILDSLPPGERRKWQLVRQRRLPELIEILRAEQRPTLRMRVARRVPVRYRPQVRRAVRALRRS
jgi:glycosyltransferase involved in cell wall biosynthesis